MSKVIRPQEPPATRGFRGLSIVESANLLRRYQHVERACLRISYGWLLNAPRYEDKYRIGYHMWDHAEHAQWLRERLQELRGGHMSASIDPQLKFALDEAIHARNTAELAGGVYLGIKKGLLDAYQVHLTWADPAANAAEIRIIERIVADLQKHIAWAEGVITRDDLDREAALEWQTYIRSLLDLAGGVSGENPISADESVERPHPHYFQRMGDIRFDDRIQDGKILASYESRSEMDIDEAVLEQFKVFFNEWWAVALLATVLYDAWDSGAPWEFFHEMTHHCWDEVRHSEFGMVRLNELGTQPDTVNLTLFRQAVNWPFLHRLVYLTLDMEAFFMSRKRPRVQRYQEAGEDRSLIFADADWSDEINHVRYGKRWSDFFLENDARSADDIKQEITTLLEKQRQQAENKVKSPF